jgi:hypothetical protein
MTLEELQTGVAQLSAADLAAFAAWFEEHLADSWDGQIKADILAGRLDAVTAQAEEAFAAGKCSRISDGPR